jgi:ribose-phosphate pyrophosphokinase
LALADEKFKIFCGTANPALCDAICSYLGVTRGRAEHGQFSDGETRYQILENVRGAALQPSGGFQPDAAAADD